MSVNPFPDLVVVELAGSMAGGYAGKLLADRGAQVMLVDPNPPPLQAEFADWHFVHGNKTIVSNLGDLAEAADVVIESSAPEPLHPRVPARNGLVRLHLSPHGSTGVYRHFLSTDLTDYALSGHQYLYGDPHRHPLPGPPNQPAIAAGLFGCVGVLAALLDGRGGADTVEVSHVEAMAALHQFTLLRHQFGHEVLCRRGNRFTGQGQPNTIYRCLDGWVAVTGVTDQQIESLMIMVGLEDTLAGLDSPQDIQLQPELLDDKLVPWLAERRRDDVVQLFQALRIPACPSLSMPELLTDEQLADRQWWAKGPGGHLIPGPPARLSHHRWTGGESAAGEAEAPIGAGPLVGKLGCDPAPERQGPLAGVKVLDLTRVWAGPLAARILADLGADVVMVEAPWNRGPKTIPASLAAATRHFPDNDVGERHWNRNGHHNKYSLNKRSVVLDLTKPEGPGVFERLAIDADVVIDNYSPRVMPQFGLGSDRLLELNPDLFVVGMPGYGRTGPARDWVAYGSCLDSHGGLSTLTGYADDHPWKGGVAWPDPIAGLHAVVAVLLGLWDRMAGTTRGQSIEVAQLESLVNAVGDQVLAAQLEGRQLGPLGGRHPVEAPHGVYPCLGHDRWVSVCVSSDEQWRALMSVAHLPAEWAPWSAADRQANHDRIDEAISVWTRTHDAHLVMYRLQEHGVAAGAVLDAAGIRSDPQFNSRALIGTIAQPEVGPMTVTRTPIRFNGRFPDLGPAPGLGADNDDVLSAAGYDGAARALLRTNSVVTDEPPD